MMSTPDYRLKKAEDENTKLRTELAELTKWTEEATEALNFIVNSTSSTNAYYQAREQHYKPCKPSNHN